MSNIVDLSVLVKEPLKIKGLDGEIYTIPGLISTNFVINLTHLEQKYKKMNSTEEQVEKIQELVVDILNLDKTKNVTIGHVKEHFNDLRVLTKIIELVMDHIRKVAEDPNSNSPESEEK